MGNLRFRAFVALNCLVLAFISAFAQQPAEPAADVLLNTARKAYADSNYPFAAEEVREFLTNFARTVRLMRHDTVLGSRSWTFQAG